MLVVHVTGVGREVLVHSERTHDCTVPYHVLLDSLHGAKAVRCASLLLVITVCSRVRQLTASPIRIGTDFGRSSLPVHVRDLPVMSNETDIAELFIDNASRCDK